MQHFLNIISLKLVPKDDQVVGLNMFNKSIFNQDKLLVGVIWSDFKNFTYYVVINYILANVEYKRYLNETNLVRV